MHGWFMIMAQQREKNQHLKQQQKIPYDLKKNDSSISDNYMDKLIKYIEECNKKKYLSDMIDDYHKQVGGIIF